MKRFLSRINRFIPLVFAVSFIFVLSIANPASSETETSNSARAFSSSTGASGGGAGASAENNIFTGTATYGIPITVPPGRLGMAPNISVGYSSHKGDGWIGVGWDLDLGSIQRDTKNGINYSGNDFVYSKNGSASPLVIVNSITNEYRAKIDDGSFIKFFYDANSGWTAYDKNGMIYYFGRTSASRQDDPADPTKIFKWNLDHVEDSNGNYMEISYDKKPGGTYQGQIYPKQIDYAWNSKTGLLPTNIVIFNLEARTDSYPSYAINFSVVTAYRLKSIETWASNQYAGKYEFTYETSYSPITKRSILEQVTRYGSDGASALPETVFFSNKNSDGTDSFLYLKQIALPYETITKIDDSNGSADLDRFKTGDFNGDGRADFLYISHHEGTNSRFYISTGNGFVQYEFPFFYAISSDTYDFHKNRFILGDFNGDGKTDILYISNRLFLARVNQDTGALSFVEVTAPSFNLYACPTCECPIPTACPPCIYDDLKRGYMLRFKTGDFNGDGKTDILFIEGNDGNSHPSAIYLATGSGYDISFTQTDGPSFTLFNTSTQCSDELSENNKAYLQRIRVADFNGDKKSDIHFIKGDVAGTLTPSKIFLFSYENDILSFTGVTGPSFEVSSGLYNECDDPISWANLYLGRIRYGDFNGDGKTDIILLRGDAASNIYLGTGNASDLFNSGEMTGPQFSISGSLIGMLVDLSRIKTGDFNGDGRTDMLRVGGWGTSEPLNIFLSKGSTFRNIQSVNSSGSTVSFFVSAEIEGCNFSAARDVNRFILGDFNGNGKTGFVYLGGVHDKYLFNIKPDTTDIIEKIQTPSGAEISLSYTSSAKFQNKRLPFALPLLTAITVNPNNPDQLHNIASTTSYSYADGYYDIEDRDFRGFGYVKQTNPDLSTLETWFHQRDKQDTSGNYTDDEDYKGKPYYTELREPWTGNTPGTLLSKTEMTWDRSVPKGTYPVFVKLAQKDIESYIGGVTVSNHEEYTYDNTNGTITTVMTSGTDAESITTQNEYQNCRIWLWRNTKTTVTGSASGKVRETTSGCETGTGNMLWKEFWRNGGSSPKITMTYWPEGNLKTQTDANGNATTADPNDNITTTTYDTVTQTFPAVIEHPQTNGVTHTYKYDYDKRFGTVIWSLDENNNQTYNTLDPFGRTIETVSYSKAGPTIAAKTKTEYYDFTSPVYIKISALETINSGVETYIDKYEYADGLGRNIQTITFGEDNTPIVTKTHYDEMGRVYLSEGPFFSTGIVGLEIVCPPPPQPCPIPIGYPMAPPAEYPWTMTTYNYFGKPTQIESPDGTYGTVITSITYSGLSTTVTDPDGKKKTEKKDYLGRVIQVTEYDGNPVYATNYTYNAAGDLLNVKDSSLNQISSMSYDTLGRKTSMTDADMGTWWYTYDQNGNLKTQKDAKLQTITFNYDELNRVKLKTYSTGEPTVTYTYDNTTISNGRGRLYSVTNTKVTTTYGEYDALGRIKNTAKTIEGNATTYTTKTGYDYAGKVTNIRYPDDYLMSYSYHPGTGLLKSAIGSDGVTYSTASNYQPTGKMGQLNFNNGTETTYSYDTWSTKLTDLLTYKGTANIQKRTYTYSPAGDIKAINDQVKGVTYNYTYDSMHRLWTETNTGTYAPVTYTYNAIGNILTKISGTNTFTYAYDPTRKHAISNMNLNGTNYSYTYDANGNMITGRDLTDLTNIASRQITYNADNMPVQVTHSRYGTTNITYDAENIRAKKVGPSGTTYYIGEHFEVISGAQTKYIFAGNLRIAKVSSAGTYYYHKDHLGSSTVMTNASGQVAETTNYMPFGEMREHTGATFTNYKFTDQEYDPETGLYYYGARYYDPVIGRFISADSVVQNPFDPQMLNRYTYCRNNPLIYTDPSGNEIATLLSLMAYSAFVGANMAYANGENIYWGAFVGAASACVGGIVGGAVAEAIKGVTSATVAGAIAGAAGGASAGVLAGGLSAAYYGGDIGQGMLMGGLIGGAIGGVMGAINGALSSPDAAPADANNGIGNKGASTTVKSDRVIFYNRENTPVFENDALLCKSALNQNLAPGEYGVFGHVTPNGKHIIVDGNYISGKDLGRALKGYGFSPGKFTSIKVYACNSAAGGQNSVAAGVWRVTHTPTTGAIGKVWGIGTGFLPVPYEALPSGKINYNAPGSWITFGGW